MKVDFERALRTTPARLDAGRVGTRPPTASWLAFQSDHAAARDAVWSEWSAAFVERIGALGFGVGASMVRGQRDTLGGVLVGLAVLAGGAVVFVARDRLALVGTFRNYTGSFGLTSYGEGPLVRGTIVMGAILLVGTAFLLYRLVSSGRRS